VQALHASVGDLHEIKVALSLLGVCSVSRRLHGRHASRERSAGDEKISMRSARC
jgi:hypothetical protein